MPRQVAVVGGGAAGAATATALDDVADVTVFEKRANVGGRSRSHEREGCRYEVGANYLRPRDDRVAALIEDVVPAEALLELDGGIRPFTGDGTIADADGTFDDAKETFGKGDDPEDGTPKGGDDSTSGGTPERRLTCTGGLDRLTEYVLEATEADVVLDTPIDALERGDGKWRLRSVDGTVRDRFDAVVLTPPAPLVADLLGRSEWPHADCRVVREGIESVPYRPITSVVLHYPFDLDRPWYALVNEDRDHPIGWLASEGRKPGYVPDCESVLLVQCSSEFTIEHFRADPSAVVDRVAILAAGLLEDDRLADPDWTDFHRWRYGVPREGVDRDSVERAANHDLFAAGDWVVGEDRLDGAFRSGLSTAERIRDDRP